LVTSMERKIERLTSEEEDRKVLKGQLWQQLKTNGHGVREKEKRIDKEEKRRVKEERENKEKRWYGITCIGQYTEGIKAILKKEGFKIFRKSKGKLETKVKKRIQKRKQEIEDKEEGGVYKVECKKCYKI